MARKRTEVNANALEILMQRILEKSNMILTRSIDCDMLADLISRDTSAYISGITFKRLFGFTKYPFNPSSQTLDILCKYIGGVNWNYFEQSCLGANVISKSEFEIFVSFFDLDFINSIEPHEGAFQSVSRKIAVRFREDPDSLIRNLDILMKMDHFQVFFVEHFPDYDNLCKYYFKVYQSYLTYNLKVEAQLFGNCMLFLKSFWLLDERECRKSFELISKVKINAQFHPYLVGRYFACHLLFHTHYGEKELVRQFIDSYMKLRSELPKNGKHFNDFPASEYVVSEALLHCGRFEDSIAIVNRAFAEYKLKMEFVRKGYYRQLQIIHSIACSKLNISINDEHKIKRINPEDFYFISSEYFKVLFFYLRNSECDREEALGLSRKMGNKYLELVFLGGGSTR